jgi:hypothetical protein
MAVSYQQFFNNTASPDVNLGKTLSDAFMQRRNTELLEAESARRDLMMQDQRIKLADLQRKQALDERARAAGAAAQPTQTTVANPAYRQYLDAHTPEALEVAQGTMPQTVQNRTDMAGTLQTDPNPEYRRGLADLGRANIDTPATILGATIPADPYGAMADVYAQGGDAAGAKEAISVRSMLAKVKAQGDPVAYEKAAVSAANYDNFVKRITPLMKTAAGQAQAQQIAEAYQAMHPEDATMYDISNWKVTEAGTVNPVQVNGKDVGFWLTDYKGETTFHKNTADAEALLDKRLAATSAENDKKIAAADARAERVAASKGGDGTDKIIAREAVKDLPKLRKDANLANSSKARLDQMIAVFDRGSAGGLKGNVLKSVSSIFDVPATSESELFSKLASAGAGQLRSTIIGPGQVSNYEQKLLQSVSGGGAGARTAVRELLLFYKQEADRTIGNYNDAVESASLVAPNARKAFKPIGGGENIGGMPRKGDVVDGYRFNGGSPSDRRSWSRVGQ